MSVLVIVAAAAVASAGPASAAPAHRSSARAPAAARMLLGQQIAAYATTFVGRYRYKWGGDTPKTGFDCSGLTSYVYGQYGKVIPRTAEAQYQAFRPVPKGKEWRGDLVFFHGKKGYVYHVGVYEGDGMMVSAADKKDGITDVTIWGGTVTFGTITHLAAGDAACLMSGRPRRCGRPEVRLRHRPGPHTWTAGWPGGGRWPR
jgi:cell wall-associated NlpC family hydrolase